ncbi:hypothetical protein E2C01_078454 [Portunus trituberculatus]|uniref:Uncharacterized protein n=1 Tax=Portunus trituberculatus TaxID=210409 RepID=A0A5B7IST4_PORTR|nr:hypothetical protein [Portunus trituberculatus]
MEDVYGSLACDGTPCTRHWQDERCPLGGERAHFMTVTGAWCVARCVPCTRHWQNKEGPLGWLGRGVWRVIAHGEPCEAQQGCIVTALTTPTGLLGWTLGEEGFVPVPVQISTPKWSIDITTPATLSWNRIVIVESEITLLSWKLALLS